MANTKVTGDLIASSTIATGNIADNAVTSDKISGITTAHITEGSNLYYTDARADARVALIVDSAPATLDTLNELAAALGDDPNFATTTANSIGLKAPLASPSFTGNATFAGNVGIGTGNTIYADLEVKRAGEVTLALHNSSAITSGNRGNLAFYNSSVSTVATIRAAADTDNVGTALEFYTRPVGGSLTNSMTIDSSGKSTFYSNEIEVYASSSSASLILNSGDATKDEWTIVTTDLAGDAYLRFVDTTTATTVMSLRDNGNLGIGATSPTTKVEINQTNNDIYQLTLHNTHLSTTAKTRIGNWVDLLKISSNYMQSGGTKTQDNTSKASWVQTMGDDLFDISRSPAGSTTLSSLMIINSLGNVGIGTDSPDAKLDILGQTLNLGGNNGSWNARTNSTVKTGFITSPHYTNAEEDIMGMIMIGLSNANEINIGGGTSTYNAATDIKFFTASNFTTVTGTERMRINSQGQTWLGGSFTGSDIANGNGTYLNNLNAGGFSVLHRNAADVYLHFNTYYNSSNNYTAKYGGSQGFRIDNGSTGGLGFYKAPVVTTAGDTQTFSHVMQVGYSASNNVGIGTTSPGEKLEVNGVIQIKRVGDHPAIRFVENTTTRGYIGTGDWAINGLPDADLGISSASTGSLVLGTNSGNGRVYIVNGGNVGIGTASPDGKLEVAGGTTLGLRITNAGDSSAYDQTRITYSGYNSGSPEMVFMPLTTPGSGVLNTFFRFRNTNGASQSSNNVANVSIDGSLGVGTTSPQTKLDVDGGVRIKTVEYTWYRSNPITSTNSYRHYKTTLHAGSGSNTMHIMGGFTLKAYAYNSNGYGEGSCMFHNWSGILYNLSVTNRGQWSNFVRSPYISSDGYVVIVCEHNTYSQPIIDFYQFYTPYGWRNATVSGDTTSNSLTGVY